jgi:hypothetical protein
MPVLCVVGRGRLLGHDNVSLNRVVVKRSPVRSEPA